MFVCTEAPKKLFESLDLSGIHGNDFRLEDLDKKVFFTD